jgi:hypothetical protein
MQPSAQSVLKPGGESGFFAWDLHRPAPGLAATIDRELGRQRCEIELIASEKIFSGALSSVSAGDSVEMPISVVRKARRHRS